MCMINCMCHYFDIIKIEDFDFDNNLLDRKSYKNIVLYDILYETLIRAKSLHMMFNEVKKMG